ncbi:MAG: DNA primase [Caldimicrobium sp.]|nr:DNA primase [Caldimicrobium sp.]MCX7873228.1 DNA primase [Caldimicrobium sp.]MDW8094118.1 DNA primase [Caldimicrobium sp.]
MTRSSSTLYEEIKDHFEIVSFISQYVKLKKVGSNYVGLCPFHQEKTPSFTVSGEKQIFKCFGCGASGDVISFYMKLKNLDFKEALIELAERAGLRVERIELGERRRERELIELLFKVAKIYQNILWNHPSGEEARAYLKKRGISEETWRDFYLGYAPPEGRFLAGFLRASNIDLKLAVEAGVLKESEDGSFVDLFRDRIIFPIFDERGQCIAFGGRALSGEVEPKYLNSPETRIFKKSESLFGLFQSKDFIKKEKALYLVEGYFDILTLWDKGIKNVVATCGTALTERHIKKLKPLAEDFFIFFDGDQAGRKATLRAIQLLAKENILPKVVVLPEGEDPDSFGRSFAKENSLELKEKIIHLSQPPIRFCYQILRGEYKGNSSKIFYELIDIFRGVEDPFIVQGICNELSFILGIPEFEVRRALRREKPISLEINEYCRKEEEPQECYLRVIAQYLLHNPEDLSFFEEVGLRDFIESNPQGLYSRFLALLLEIQPKSELELLNIPENWVQELLSDLLFSPPFENREEVKNQIKEFLLRQRRKKELERIIESIKFFERTGKKAEVEITLHKIKGALNLGDNLKI